MVMEADKERLVTTVTELAGKEGWEQQPGHDGTVRFERASTSGRQEFILAVGRTTPSNINEGPDATIDVLEGGVIESSVRGGIESKSKALSIYLSGLDGRHIEGLQSRSVEGLQLDLVKQAARDAAHNASRYGAFPGRAKQFANMADDLVGVAYHLESKQVTSVDQLLAKSLNQEVEPER